MAVASSTATAFGRGRFLEAIADPQHPDHEDRLDWYGGPFEPADMDVAQISQELARIAARRRPTPPKGKL